MLSGQELIQSCSLEYEEEKDTDVVDPELFIDVLPQPYRNIDFILNELISCAFEYYLERNERRRIEATKRKVSDLECEAFIFKYGLPDVILAGPLGRLIVGARNSFSVLDDHNYSCRSSSEDLHDTQKIQDAKVVKIGETTWLLPAINTSGQFYLYGVCEMYIFLLKNFSEMESTTENVKAALSVVLSNDGSYVAVVWEEPDNSIYVDVYILPKENWIKELSVTVAKIKPAQADQDADLFPKDNLMLDQDGTEGDDTALQGEVQHMFSKPTSLMKIPLTVPSSKPSVMTLGSALRTVDGENAQVGSGYNHLLTQPWMDSFNEKMQGKFNQYLRFLPPVDEKCSLPTVRFLGPTKRRDPASTDEPSVTLVAIARSDCNQIYGYALPKTSKVLDSTKKVDMVIPNTGGIIYCSVSVCTTLLALVTEANHLIIWNRNLARPLKTISLCAYRIPLFCKFASVEGQISMEERLLLGIASGEQLFAQIECSYHECSDLLPVKDSSAIEEDEVQDIFQYPYKQTLVLGARKSGTITIFDLVANDSLGHIKAPEGLQFCFKLEPFLCFSKTRIFIKATRTEIMDDLEDGNFQGGILVFSLENITPNKDEVLVVKHGNKTDVKKIPAMKDWKLQLLRRYQQREQREKRIQKRWKEFRRELKVK